MDRTPSIRKHISGRYGLYIGTTLLATAKTEERAKVGVKLLERAFQAAFDDGFSDGHTEGYDEGHCDGYAENDTIFSA